MATNSVITKEGQKTMEERNDAVKYGLLKTTIFDEEMTHREKEKIKAKHKYTCAYCGCKNKLMLTVEHKTPRSRGGTSTDKNLTCSCYICNQLKGGLTDIEFRQYYKNLQQLKDLQKISLQFSPPKLIFKPGHTPNLT